MEGQDKSSNTNVYSQQKDWTDYNPIPLQNMIEMYMQIVIHVVAVENVNICL